MSRILFVYPFQLSASALEQEWRTLYPPLGLLYLAAFVRDSGHTVSFYDGTFKEAEHAEFDVELTKFNADVVTPISEMSGIYLIDHYPRITRLLQWKFKKRIEKISRIYLSGAVNGYSFKQFKEYHLLVYEKM